MMMSQGSQATSLADSFVVTQVNAVPTTMGISAQNLIPLSISQLSSAAVPVSNVTSVATLTTLANVSRTSAPIKFTQQPLAINLALENASAALAAINANKKTAKKKKPANNNNSGCSCCCAAEKPYVCDWANCGKRFRQKPHLEAHKNIHTGRRFICEWTSCGKSFVRKYNLVEHQKLHSSVNSNMCTYPDCGKVFSSKYSLVRHQNAQHNLSL